MKIEISYETVQAECAALCGETVQYCFAAANKSKGKHTFHLADGKKPIGYLVGVTEEGFYLVPLTGKSKSPEIRRAEAFFLAKTAIKKIGVVREYPEYRVRLVLQNGDYLRWEVKIAGKQNAETRQHLKELRTRHLKYSRCAEAGHYIYYVVIGLFIGCSLGFMFGIAGGRDVPEEVGNSLILQAEEYGQNLFTPLLPYTQTNYALDGETQEYQNADFCVRLPKTLPLERETDEQLQYGNADTGLFIVIYKAPYSVNFEQDFPFAAEAKANCETYFGFAPDSWYHYQKIGYGLDFNALDPKDEVACQLYTVFMTTKAFGPKDAAFYCAERENCYMLLTENTANTQTFLSAELYNPALPNQFYTVTVIARTQTDLETAYAVLNSVAFTP